MIKYLTYWATRKKLQSEKATIGRLDTVNKTTFKKNFEVGELDTLFVAKSNHESGMLYDFVNFENDYDPYPSHYVSVYGVNKHIGTHFIDPSGRNYLTYLFRKMENEKFFIHEIWFYEFSNEDTDTMKSRTHFVFDEEGNVNYRVYDMIQNKTMDYESKEPFDVTGLYEPYPEFGEYEGIIKLERDIPMINDVIS